MKTKAHFKIHLSIGGHRNTAVMWESMINRAIYVSLGILALEKYAPKTNDTFHVSSSDLMAVTGCKTGSAAAKRWASFLSDCRVGAESLGGEPVVTAESVGSHWRVTIRNLGKKQGFDPKFGTGSFTPEAEAKAKAKAKRTTVEAPAPTKVLPGECSELAAYLKRGILKVTPNARVPKDIAPPTWAKVIDAMHRLDDRPYDGIKAAITWLYTDNQKRDEAQFVVLSAASLREKYDRIAIQMEGDAAPRRKREAVKKREDDERRQREDDRRAAVRGVAGEVVIDLAAVLGGQSK